MWHHEEKQEKYMLVPCVGNLLTKQYIYIKDNEQYSVFMKGKSYGQS